MEIIHTVDETLIEGRCCVSTSEAGCVPNLSEACPGPVCSVGMAGTGLFKLGCISNGGDNGGEPRNKRVCEDVEMRGTDVISCPEKFVMVDIVSKCPDGIHENCVIHVTCCIGNIPVKFDINRHVPASIYPVELFESVIIDCQM